MNLVVLHGWGQSKKDWDNIVSMFPENQITVLDLPGFGSEPLVSPDWGIPEYATWVEKKITEMNEKEIVLIGHSFGGRIASMVAMKNPSWLKALILYAAPCIYRPSFTILFKIRVYKILKALGLKKKKTSNTELNSAEEEGLGKIFRKAVVFDQTETLKEISIPTLILWGENDSVSSVEIGKEMDELIPHSKLTTLQNLGHNIHIENPTLFYGTVKNYVENL